MLKVTLHAGPSSTANFNNSLGSLEIAYASRPEPLSDYKAVVVANETGASAPILIEQYPRYAAPIWDLIVRVLCAYLRPEGAKAEERLWLFEPHGKFIPYASAMSAIVTLQSAVQRDASRVLATCDLKRLPGCRGRYEARFTEDCLDDHRVDSFAHRPAVLNHWQLLQTALAWRLAGEEVLPPRPFIFAPDPITTPAGVVVSIENLSEPARTCFERWLARQGHRCELDRGFAAESHYLDFLHALS